ncbi:MAG: calcium-binding protein [Thermoleophilaceae bacterium]
MRITEFRVGPNPFVELQDPGDEPFANPPYRLVFYDERGNRLDGDNLLRSGLDGTGTNPYTVGINQPNSDENLKQNVVINQRAGQICLTRGPNEDKIHCVAYGCVVSPLRTGFVGIGGGLDPAPLPNGLSSQRQGSGRYNLGSPTPDAPNVAGRREFTCIINGNGGANLLIGTPFDDRIRGFGGRDRIRGLAGNDRISGGGARDRVLAGAGNDRVFGGTGNDRLRGGSGNDRIRGEGGNDRLFGDSGNDRLAGGRGRDGLFGNSGRDILRGGPSLDFLSGGRGIDDTAQ